MTRPEWDCTWESPTEEEIADEHNREARAILWPLVPFYWAWRFCRWMFRVERRER